MYKRNTCFLSKLPVSRDVYKRQGPNNRFAWVCEQVRKGDYLGNKRSRKNSYPGAIEFEKGGMQKLKVY